MVYGASNSHLIPVGVREDVEEMTRTMHGEAYAPPNLGWNSSEEASLYGPQELYRETTSRVIDQVSRAIQEAVDEQADLIIFFETVLKLCCVARQTLARASEDTDWRLFGEFRKPGAGDLITYICKASDREDYRCTHDAMTDMIQGELKRMNDQSPPMRNDIVESMHGHRRFSRKIERLGPQELQRNHWNKNPFEDGRHQQVLQSFCKIFGQEDDEIFFMNLKKSYRDIYQQHRMNQLLEDIEKKLQCKVTEYILVTPEMSINNQMCPLSQILISGRVRQKHGQSPPSPIYAILHQDDYLQKESLLECARLFQDAVCWQSDEGIPELKERVALFRYLFAHVSPFSRGSAAIGEWIEMGLYSYHNLLAFRVEKSCMSSDLVAFATSLFPEFLSDYNDRIEVVQDS